MKYRKKPVVIDAIQWDEKDETVAELNKLGILGKMFYGRDDAWYIITLEGAHEVSMGDWIIRGVKGEFYACKPDIFQLTYELAE